MPKIEPSEAAQSLRALADMVEAANVPVAYADLSIWHTRDKAELASLVRAGLAAGAVVTKRFGEAPYDQLFEVEFTLGAVKASVLSRRDSVCERVEVGTETITEKVPDPDAPKVTIPDPTRTIEVSREVTKYEWRCGSILDGQPAEAVG